MTTKEKYVTLKKSHCSFWVISVKRWIGVILTTFRNFMLFSGCWYSVALDTKCLFCVSQLTLSSAETIILVWVERTINKVNLIKDLKPIVKNLKLKLLRNKDKTTHICVIAGTPLKQGKVKVNTSTVSADFTTLVWIDKVVNHVQKCWANQGTWSDCQDSQTESAQERKDKIYVLFKASWLWWLFCWKLLDCGYMFEFIMDGYLQQA